MAVTVCAAGGTGPASPWNSGRAAGDRPRLTASQADAAGGRAVSAGGAADSPSSANTIARGDSTRSTSSRARGISSTSGDGPTIESSSRVKVDTDTCSLGSVSRSRNAARTPACLSASDGQPSSERRNAG